MSARALRGILTTIEEHSATIGTGDSRSSNVRLVGTLLDGDSKAILIFMMVSLLVLPLSFVTGLFGMIRMGHQE